MLTVGLFGFDGRDDGHFRRSNASGRRGHEKVLDGLVRISRERFTQRHLRIVDEPNDSAFGYGLLPWSVRWRLFPQRKRCRSHQYRGQHQPRRDQGREFHRLTSINEQLLAL